MVFAAYGDKTPKGSTLSKIVDIIQIIKYEWQQIAEIYPFADLVGKNYKDWIFERNKNKQGERGAGSEPFTAEQMQWLELIRDYIAVNASISPQAMRSGKFMEMGGSSKFAAIFGSQAKSILIELNSKLAA